MFYLTKARGNKTPWKEGQGEKINQELETNLIIKYWSKFFFKCFSSKTKICSLIISQQTAYVQNRYIGEAGRLISDILNISDELSIDGYLDTVNIKNDFHSLNHGFLLVVLKKFGLGNSFIDWIKMLLTNEDSCVINGGNTTSYFKVEKGARQDDPISAYLFITALEIIFTMIKSNPNIKGLSHHNISIITTCILRTQMT